MIEILTLILILSLPLGPAVQGIACTLWITAVVLNQLRQPNYQIFKTLRTSIHLPAALFILWLSFSSLMNTGDVFASGHTFFGYLSLFMIPAFLVHVIKPPSNEQWLKLTKLLTTVLIVWTLICISQKLFGWKLQGTQIVSTEYRARGFYSHPLTLAYVIVLLIPFAFNNLLAKLNSSKTWLWFACVMGLVYASNSRTIQILTGLVFLWSILVLLKGRQRIIAVGLVVITVLAIAFTDNSISKRFHSTMQGTEDHTALNYADDRLAFWDANWHLFLDKPILGHGEKVNKSARAAAYEKIGLGDLEKKYESHNMYLEILVSTGIVGLLLYLWWFVELIKLIRQRVPDLLRTTMLQTVIIFHLGGLMQNALQDSEPRLALALTVGIIHLFLRSP